MVFCGENVVSLWFFVVILGVVFRALKNFNPFENISVDFSSDGWWG
jgi:hypothetical protein